MNADPRTPSADGAGTAPEAELLLPDGARLLHIGIPKTGTTALQQAASSRRSELRANGVLYPGRTVNHRDAVSGLMGRRWGWSGKGSSIPPRSAWDKLMTEVNADRGHRILISHEFGSEADDAAAREFAAELGPSTHVVVTLRAVGAILPSAWQQYIKTGYIGGFDEWLSAVVGEEPDLAVTPSYHRRNDQGGVVRRWADAVGAQNVTVVILDKTRPQLLYEAFEGMLGLPQGALRVEGGGGFRANRGMSLAEAEVIRNFNVLIRGRQVDWSEYHSLIRLGAAARMLETRMPDASEEPVRLPEWAASRAMELGRRYAEEIADSGVRVVGDLDLLHVEVPVRDDDKGDQVSDVPLEIAVETLGGMFSAATGRGSMFNDPVAAKPVTGGAAIQRTADKPTAAVSTVDLVKVLGGRVVRKGQDIRRDRRRRAERKRAQKTSASNGEQR